MLMTSKRRTSICVMWLMACYIDHETRSEEMKMEGSLSSGSPCHVKRVKTSAIKVPGITNDDFTLKDLTYNGTDKSLKTINDTNLLELSIHNNNAKLSEAEEMQNIYASSAESSFFESSSQYDVITKADSAIHGALEYDMKFNDSNSNTVERVNNGQLVSSSLAKQHFKGQRIDDSSKKEKTEEFSKLEIKYSQQHKNEGNLGSVRKLWNWSEDVPFGALANSSDAEAKANIKRSRAALSAIPSEEKLKILNNIYEAIIEWNGTWQHHSNFRVWSPYLVFSTIEAAKMGNDEVKKVLESKDGSLQLLFCYEAICELVFSFPGENLLPTPFVREYLLVFDTHQLLEQVKNNTLLSFRDADSALFWGTLISHCLYLATHNLATVVQIASIFSGILMPMSRFKDLSKEEYMVAKLNLNMFITHLIADKAEGSSFSYKQDCLEEADELVSLKKHDKKNRSVHVVGEAINESKSSFISQDKMTSCISCSLILRILFCRRWK